MIGQLLAQYRIEAQLGAGAMGVVYRAHDTALERTVAVKFLTGDAGPGAYDRLLEEARSASRLNHPNICTVHEVARSGDHVFIVMECVEGRSLEELITPGGLPPDVVVDYGLQISEALSHAHDRGVVHRDLKPANVRVTPAGVVKVLDFGVALRVRDEVEGSTRTAAARSAAGAMAGTLPYLAPETLRGDRQDALSDVWALGVLLHVLATGEHPFQGRTAFELTSSILRDAPRPLPQELRAGLRRAVAGCLAKDRLERFHSAADVRAALQGAAAAQRPRRAGARSATSAGRTGRKRVGTLAVLPLENLSRSADEEYFADGMTEALISRLARISALRVISRTSVMRYKGTRAPLPDIAARLGADAIVEGSVLRVGDRVRITVQLVDAGTDTHLWAGSYDRDLHDVLTLQSKVAETIAQSIDVKVTANERKRLRTARRVAPGVHEKYLRGRYYLGQNTEEACWKALHAFREAIEGDPTDASASAALAFAYMGLVWYGALPPREAFPRGKAAATRAVGLEPDLGEAHVVLAYAAIFYDWDRGDAERRTHLALDLSPSDPLAHLVHAWYLLTQCRFDEAQAAVDRARALDPLSPMPSQNVGWTHYFARRDREAIRECRHLLALDPASPVQHWMLGLSLIAAGAHDEAIGMLQEGVRLLPNADYVARLGWAYAAGGRRADALAVLDQLRELASKRYVPVMEIARIHAALGDRDAAFGFLDAAHDERAPWLAYLHIDPSMDPLRDDPRFETLVARVGIAPPRGG